MYQVNEMTTLRDGTPVRVIAVSEFEGYATYTVENSGRTMDVDDSELESTPTSDRDIWTIVLFVSIVGGGLFMLLVRTLLLGG